VYVSPLALAATRLQKRGPGLAILLSIVAILAASVLSSVLLGNSVAMTVTTSALVVVTLVLSVLSALAVAGGISRLQKKDGRGT
jgi:membrane protein implicated in regulation of membrane protease activity